MTREEVIKMLNWIAPNYPNARITDARMMVDTWSGAFAETSCEDVYKAVVLHMSHSTFFPTIADIKKCLDKVVMVYSDSPVAPVRQIEASTKNYTEEYYEWIDNILDIWEGM